MAASDRVKAIQAAAERVAFERLRSYRATVRKVAEGSHIDPEDVVTLCELCAVPVEQFGEDVGVIEERIKAAKLLAELPAIRAEKARLAAELEARFQEFKKAEAAWHEQAHAIGARQNPLEARETDCQRARRKLIDTFAKAEPDAAAMLDEMRREQGECQRAAREMRKLVNENRRLMEIPDYDGTDNVRLSAMRAKNGARLQLPEQERRLRELDQRENELRAAAEAAEAAVLLA